jgi:hypothetical protein
MDGRNVVIIQGFKEYCALGFFQGARHDRGVRGFSADIKARCDSDHPRPSACECPISIVGQVDHSLGYV